LLTFGHLYLTIMSQLVPFKQRRSLLGIICHQLVRKRLEVVLPDDNMMQKNTPT
jgi:hypothetical protein